MDIDSINLPEDLKGLSDEELQDLSKQLRRYIIKTVSRTGGHLSSNLGIVELTIALHTVFSSPDDKIVFDVGHQCYAHKILTGRREQMSSLRTKGGLSGFPVITESVYDAFGTGHAGTSVSAALGIDRAAQLLKKDHYSVAVVGDGALGNGMIYEAINDAGNSSNKLIIVLNDNNMSISPNVGAISSALSRMRSTRHYYTFKKAVQKCITGLPRFEAFLHRMKNGIKYMFVSGALFEELGLFYIGPIDGHNIKKLRNALERAKKVEGPVLVHVITQKGHGYKAAEKDPTRYHSSTAFMLRNGKKITKKKNRDTFVDKLSGCLIDLAEEDSRIVAVTAAMPDATGLNAFKERFPDRFFDVGIAEEHAITMAAGMAANGLRPVVPIYSTFLQRAYDSILHDVCIQNLPVIILADHAGVVGDDGKTHQGVFDLSFLRTIPNLTILTPVSPDEMQAAMKYCLTLNAPCVIRYPKGDNGATIERLEGFPKPIKTETDDVAHDCLILAVGVMLKQALDAKEILNENKVRAKVVGVRQVKPFDEELYPLILENSAIITIEDNVLAGGFGSEIAEYITDNGLRCGLLRLGVPDRFIDHQTRSEALRELGLDSTGIANSVEEFLRRIK